MSNSHDEIKKLLEASRKLLNNDNINEDIRRQYGLLTEQGVDITGDNVTKKINVAKSVEDTIDYETADTDGNGFDDEEESGDDKTQGYRISGGILVLHGKEQTDLELTTDEKIAYQEPMDEFIFGVSDMVVFDKLNVCSNNVEWSGKLIEYDIEFNFIEMEYSNFYDIYQRKFSISKTKTEIIEYDKSNASIADSESAKLINYSNYQSQQDEMNKY